MKTLRALALAMVLLAVIPMAASANIPELYPDQIVTLGSVKRVYFHLRQCDDVTQECAWLYFGTSASQQPPTTGDPVSEYTYVQFPTAFDDLGDGAIPTMFDLALQAGRRRQGIDQMGVAAFFPDEYQDLGVSRTFAFHLLSYDGNWYYFGSDPAEYPPLPAGPVVEVAEVQFPRDFDLVGGGDEGDAWLYDIALWAGLAREGINP